MLPVHSDEDLGSLEKRWRKCSERSHAEHRHVERPLEAVHCTTQCMTSVRASRSSSVVEQCQARIQSLHGLDGHPTQGGGAKHRWCLLSFS